MRASKSDTWLAKMKNFLLKVKDSDKICWFEIKQTTALSVESRRLWCYLFTFYTFCIWSLNTYRYFDSSEDLILLTCQCLKQPSWRLKNLPVIFVTFISIIKHRFYIVWYYLVYASYTLPVSQVTQTYVCVTRVQNSTPAFPSLFFLFFFTMKFQPPLTCIASRARLI